MRILWAFELECASNPTTGALIPIDLEDLHEGTVIAPNPFQCSFHPRGKTYLESIERNFTLSKEVFKLYERESLT